MLPILIWYTHTLASAIFNAAAAAAVLIWLLHRILRHTHNIRTPVVVQQQLALSYVMMSGICFQWLVAEVSVRLIQQHSVTTTTTTTSTGKSYISRWIIIIIVVAGHRAIDHGDIAQSWLSLVLQLVSHINSNNDSNNNDSINSNDDDDQSLFICCVWFIVPCMAQHQM